MDRHECRDHEEQLDRAAWEKAWRQRRKAERKGRGAVPEGRIGQIASACIMARLEGERAAARLSSWGRFARSHEYRSPGRPSSFAPFFGAAPS